MPTSSLRLWVLKAPFTKSRLPFPLTCNPSHLGEPDSSIHDAGKQVERGPGAGLHHVRKVLPQQAHRGAIASSMRPPCSTNTCGCAASACSP